jgi:uncharacterized protein (TIGR02391 family)
MHNLVHLISDVEILLALEPEELGAKLLFLVRKREGDDKMFHPQSMINELYGSYSGGPTYPRERQQEVELANMEAWAWLEAQGLIVPEPGTNGQNGWRRLSRRARRMESQEELTGFATARRLPKELIHPRIADKVWMALVRGEFDSAALMAMRAVEISVREACGYPNSVLGVTLMRKAFDVRHGPLTDNDPNADGGEKDAIMHLFSGAIGYFKNPLSHREVGISESNAAIEIIMLASHLLRIVDERRSALNSRRSQDPSPPQAAAD